MSTLGESASAAVFDLVEEAERAWEVLVEAGIPAVVITDPGLLGKRGASVEVERVDLERAIEALEPFLGEH